MPGIGLLHKWLRDACPSIHRARLSALVKVVHGLLVGGRLTLTALGRQLPTAAFAKHNIKCVDRLLGNAHLQHERVALYRAVAQWVLAKTPHPVLLVDWSDCEPGHKHLMLKAAVPLRGRALSIYEEVYPLARYNSPRPHRRFLRNLRAVLPEYCRPIIVTDAGFRGPWFREVERYGWDWLGRVRNKVKFALEQTPGWRYTTALYLSAPPQPPVCGPWQTVAQTALCLSALSGQEIPAWARALVENPWSRDNGKTRAQAVQSPLAHRHFSAEHVRGGKTHPEVVRAADAD